MKTQKPNLKEVGGNVDTNHTWSLENPSVKGYYYECKEGVGTNGDSSIHTVVTLDGENKVFWGSTILDDKLSSLGRMGTYVEITFLGSKPNKKNSNSSNHFRLEEDPSMLMEGFQAEPQAEPKAESQAQPKAQTQDVMNGEKGPWDE